MLLTDLYASFSYSFSFSIQGISENENENDLAYRSLNTFSSAPRAAR